MALWERIEACADIQKGRGSSQKRGHCHIFFKEWLYQIVKESFSAYLPIKECRCQKNAQLGLE